MQAACFNCVRAWWPCVQSLDYIIPIYLHIVPIASLDNPESAHGPYVIPIYRHILNIVPI